MFFPCQIPGNLGPVDVAPDRWTRPGPPLDAGAEYSARPGRMPKPGLPADLPKGSA